MHAVLRDGCMGMCNSGFGSENVGLHVSKKCQSSPRPSKHIYIYISINNLTNIPVGGVLKNNVDFQCSVNMF